MKVIVSHPHKTASAAARHCWDLTQGGWSARVVTEQGQTSVEVGPWVGFKNVENKAANSH